MFIEAKNTPEAFRKGKELLLTLPDSIDPEILKESPATFSFKDLTDDNSIPHYNGERFYKIYEYASEISKQLAEEEFLHYQNLLNQKVKDLILYLKENPLSKRAIIFTWNDSQTNLENKSECLIYLNFRKTNTGLMMNVHMRANNAKDKFLLNLHIFSSIHRFVAEQLREAVGEYRHSVDSYHLYRV